MKNFIWIVFFKKKVYLIPKYWPKNARNGHIEHILTSIYLRIWEYSKN